jgi:hypothetical protein
MKYPYDEAFSPPAPLLPIEIFVPEEPQQRAQVDAKLDTAADISAIPSRIVNEWDLEPVSEIMVVGYDAETEVLPTYTVGLELPHARIRHIEVLVIPEPYALLGRDVLNHFYVNLSGPELTFAVALSPLL